MRKEANLVDSALLDKIQIKALAAAEQASDLLKAGFYSTLDVSVKSHIHDLVTQYDTNAEKLIKSVVDENFPDHAFIGEETGINGDIKNQITWIVDPIDGTWNFAKQIPSFAISIAVHYKGETQIGICLDPISGELFTARKGEGATMNGRKLEVSDVDSLEKSGLSLGAHIGLHEIERIAMIRRTGSSVLDLCYVAKGALDGFIDNRQRIWDYAAAKLVVEEAGGTVTDFSGNPLTFDTEKPTSIIASNQKIHKEVREWISTDAK